MVTLMQWGNSDGWKGRCDAKCHDATDPKCNCMCGGMNHGAGAEQALENTREHFKKMIKEYEKKHGKQTVLLANEIIQEDLFK